MGQITIRDGVNRSLHPRPGPAAKLPWGSQADRRQASRNRNAARASTKSAGRGAWKLNRRPVRG